MNKENVRSKRRPSPFLETIKTLVISVGFGATFLLLILYLPLLLTRLGYLGFIGFIPIVVILFMWAYNDHKKEILRKEEKRE